MSHWLEEKVKGRVRGREKRAREGEGGKAMQDPGADTGDKTITIT